MKKPLAILSTDWHLKTSNIDLIKKLVKDQCALAIDKGAKYLFILGDIFDSRLSQRLDVLRAFNEILDIIHSAKLIAVMIPGNHDKTLYNSRDSFLDPFRNHPCLMYIDLYGAVPFPELTVHFLPFFENEIWLSEFTELMEFNGGLTGTHILCSHIAVQGSINNDGSKVESTIKSSMFKGFHKVFLGHYHNQQKIGENIYHIPSICQNNFGEDDQKGYTVLYSDSSHELVKAQFPEYKKIQIDLDIQPMKEIESLAKEYFNSTDNIRFEFSGDESKIKALKKDFFTNNGIDVKTKIKEIEDNIEFSATEEVTQFDKSSIVDEFKKFCDENDLDYGRGINYLNKKLI